MKRVLALQFCWDDPPGYLGDIMQEQNIPYEIVEVDKYAVPDPTEFESLATGLQIHRTAIQSAVAATLCRRTPNSTLMM